MGEAWNTVRNLMGYHLYGDIKHDFGGEAPFYNINGEGAAGRVGATAKDEDSIVGFFLREANPLVYDVAARKKGEIIFTVPEKTASFQNWKAPLLYEGGNDKLGVIQDAGEFITKSIGAKNVIAFGSILDPAGKPIRSDQKPIWFEPEINNVDIPLVQFGFDSNVISALRIKDLTAGTVKAGYIVGEQVIDGVAMAPGEPTLSKPINTTKIDKAGFFTSIAKADNIKEELILAGKTQAETDAIQRAYGQNFYIGKTLGDASLVASAMPSFKSNDGTADIPNPYTGIEAGGSWKEWVSGDVVMDPPTVLALKTGDRLNWIRAIYYNVPAIYEDQAKGARKTKQYRFFPGTADPVKIREAILGDFTKIQNEVNTRYTLLRDNLSALVQDGKFRIDLSTFAPGGAEVLKPKGAENAARLITDIVDRLGLAMDGVSAWVAGRRVQAETIESNDNLRTFYQDTLSRANACSPQASTILITKGRGAAAETYLSSKLVVANVPQGVSAPEWPLQFSLDIALRNAFSNFNKDGNYEDLVRGTDIDNRFLSRVTTPLSFLSQESIKETVQEVVGDLEAQTGGAIVTVTFGPGFRAEFLDGFSTIKDFLEYLATNGVREWNRAFPLMYEVVRRRNSKRVIEPFLVEELSSELATLVAYKHIKFSDETDIFVPDFEIPKDIPSTEGTVLFDAYSYHVNARNANAFETETTSVQDFRSIEQEFLNALNRNRSGVARITPPKTVTRRNVKAREDRALGRRMKYEQRKTKTVGDVFRSKRGLDTSPTQTTDGDIVMAGGAVRRGLYAGLRERSEPSTSPGVRQHSSNSRTRRQRKYVDRV